jgi:hypothetical protein
MITSLTTAADQSLFGTQASLSFADSGNREHVGVTENPIDFSG